MTGNCKEFGSKFYGPYCIYFCLLRDIRINMRKFISDLQVTVDVTML